jgi:hypothetical protein
LVVTIILAGCLDWQETEEKRIKEETTSKICTDLRQTRDGGFILVGGIDCGDGLAVTYAVKTNAQGKKEWERTYKEGFSQVALSVQLAPDSGYIIGGGFQPRGKEGKFLLLKIDSKGNKEWQKTYGPNGKISLAYCLYPTSDDGYILAGSTGAPAPDEEWYMGLVRYATYVVKVDSRGNWRWSKEIKKIDGEEMINRVYSIIPASDGGYVGVGSAISLTPHEVAPMILLKLDARGNQKWCKKYSFNGKDIVGVDICQTPDGGYLAVGTTESEKNADFYILKTDPRGNKEWEKTYGKGYADEAHSVQLTRDGGYIVTGFTENRYSVKDFCLLKLDSKGNLEWLKTYGGKKDDNPSGVVQTPDGGYAIAGDTDSFNSGGSDFYLVKTDPNGKVEWQKTYGR